MVNSTHSKSSTALTHPWSEVSVELFAEEMELGCGAIGKIGRKCFRTKNWSRMR
jgi:hypothetical protein